MKNLNIALILIINAFFFSSCRDRTKASSDIIKTQDTVHQQLKGLPLDNLHRSRTGDSTVDVNDNKSGLPLNNLERDDATDTVGHL
nr:hypothetical protein [uncultured Sphingobacterium sp.]